MCRLQEQEKSREKTQQKIWSLKQTQEDEMLPDLTCDDCGHVHEPGRLCRKLIIVCVFICTHS